MNRYKEKYAKKYLSRNKSFYFARSNERLKTLKTMLCPNCESLIKVEAQKNNVGVAVFCTNTNCSYKYRLTKVQLGRLEKRLGKKLI